MACAAGTPEAFPWYPSSAACPGPGFQGGVTFLGSPRDERVTVNLYHPNPRATRAGTLIERVGGRGFPRVPGRNRAISGLSGGAIGPGISPSLRKSGRKRRRTAFRRMPGQRAPDLPEAHILQGFSGTDEKMFMFSRKKPLAAPGPTS